MKRPSYFFGISLLVHSLLFAAIVGLRQRTSIESPIASVALLVQLDKATSVPNARVAQGMQKKGDGIKRGRKLDLRPSFAKAEWPGLFAAVPKPQEGEGRLGSEGADAGQKLLKVEGLTLVAFDQLANLISTRLEYPSLLAENGIAGLATLDLYFDESARIDESRSKFFGANRWVRGLLVHATRQGLVDWFQGAGMRLSREQFSNQHFRADFVVTYTGTAKSELYKEGMGNYRIIRRKSAQTCLNPSVMGVDVACAAMKVAGFVSRTISDDYRMRYEMLRERLEGYDEQGIRGLNEEIARKI